MPLSLRRVRASAIGYFTSLSVNFFAQHAFEKFLDLALLLGLAVDPIADHLLLGAHVVHEALDRLGEIGHGIGGGLAGAGLVDGFAQTFDRRAHFDRDAGAGAGFRRLIV